MSLTRSEIKAFTKELLGVVSQMLNERPAPIGITAHVVPGSYREGDGTVEVLIDDTFAAYQLAQALGDSDATQMLTHPRVPVANHDPNDQYGFRGGEPVLLIPSQRGYVAKAIPDAQTNDAPGAGPFFSVQAPSGERWLCHRNSSNEIDAYIKLTNNGSSGDGRGGLKLLAGALFSLATAGGISIVADDSTTQLQAQTAGNFGILADDSSSTVGIGSSGGAGLGSTDGVVRQKDLKSVIDALRSELQTWGAANFQSGTSSPPEPAEVTIDASATVLASD